jgi:hypothetical protein
MYRDTSYQCRKAPVDTSKLHKAVLKWKDVIPDEFKEVAETINLKALWKKATSGKKGDHSHLKAIAHILLSFWPGSHEANKEISSVLY